MKKKKLNRSQKRQKKKNNTSNAHRHSAFNQPIKKEASFALVIPRENLQIKNNEKKRNISFVGRLGISI